MGKTRKYVTGFDAESGVFTIRGSGIFSRKAWERWREEIEKVDASRVVFETGEDAPIVFPEDCSYMFAQTTFEVVFPKDVDMSRVRNMEGMFFDARAANPDVSGWDVSNVRNMCGMFWGAQQADPDVSKWDVGKVTNMMAMFALAVNANPDVSGWDVSNVTDMSHMFRSAHQADPDVSRWDVSKVRDMSHMFAWTKRANPDVSRWDVSRVKNMVKMFQEAKKANPDVSGWRLSMEVIRNGGFDQLALPKGARERTQTQQCLFTKTISKGVGV